MAILQDIINGAYREQQLLDINRAPDAAQNAEALTLLRGIIQRAIIQQPQAIIHLGAKPKTGRGQRNRNFDGFRAHIALPSNVYVHALLTEPMTLDMPFNPGDGARVVIVDVAKNFNTHNLTLNGNGNTINGAATETLTQLGIVADYFYRRDIADWRLVAPLSANTPMPFPEQYDDMFVLLLSARLLVRYGRTLDAVSTALLDDMVARFKSQYQRMPSDVEADVLFETDFSSHDTSGAIANGHYFG